MDRTESSFNSLSLNTTNNDDSMISSFDNSSGFLCQTKNEDSFKKLQRHKKLTSSSQQQQQQQRNNNNGGNRHNRTPIQLCDFFVEKLQQTTTTTTKTISQSQQKKIKRVQPLTVSRNLFETQTTSIFSGSSAFSNDNNIINISKNVIELEPHNNDEEAQRKSLQQDVNNITKLMQSTPPISSSTPTKLAKNCEKLQNSLQFNNMHYKHELHIFAAIYSILLDMNFVNNILQEIATLFTLLNTMQSAMEEQESSNYQIKKSKLELLQNSQNSIYFAALVLTQQRDLFEFLDLKTLNTILSSERLLAVASSLHAYLNAMHNKKQQLISLALKQRSHKPGNQLKTLQSAYINEAEDLRKNFASMQDFREYRRQRDGFFKIFKLWESNHLHPQWNFQKAAACKVRELFSYCEHAVNMQHLAKLFIAKLLLSMTPHELGLDVNMHKFHLLSQRLINAENFNMNYDFPGHQLFFCEFVLSSRSIAFIEQLKLQLYARLMELNNDNICENTIEGEYVLPAQLLKNMLILAKFLAYLMNLPYLEQEQELPLVVRQQQLQLRQQLQAPIDLFNILVKALKSHKILITLPWLFQYLIMLNDIDLCLPYNLKTLHLLFSLLVYKQIKPLSPTAYYVLRFCMSGLCARKSSVNEEFLKFRCSGYNLAKNLQQRRHLQGVMGEYWSQIIYLREELIKESCSELAQFRAHILHCSSAYMKSFSRTGRYRHITTRYAANVSNQQLLLQAFLEQQSPATRRLLDFLMEHLKQLVLAEVEQQLLAIIIEQAEKALLLECADLPKNVADFNKKVELAFIENRLLVMPQFEQVLAASLRKRIELALQALLPQETKAQMRQVYVNLIVASCEHYAQEFLNTQFENKQYFDHHIKDMAKRLMQRRESSLTDLTDSSETRINSSDKSVAGVIEELQHYLYFIATKQQDYLNLQRILEFLEQRVVGVFVHQLPPLFYRNLSQQLVQLLQQLIIHFPKLLQESQGQLFEHVVKILNREEMIAANHQFQVHRFINKDILEGSELTVEVNYCQSLISVEFLQNLNDCQQRYDLYLNMLIKFMSERIINVKFINEQFISIFKVDWEPQILQLISNLLRKLATYANTLKDANSEHDSDELTKENLFLDLLADISNDHEFL